MSENLSEHVAENRRYWDAMADQWVSGGERAWEQEARWGEWQIPNTELPLLTDDMHGQRVIELGCGTGYVSAWMRRRGATVYAIDNSDAQLATARRLSERHGLNDIEWVHGNAETVAQPDRSFDFAISEYGAAIWCEPAAWISEAHRLLRPGGDLVFLGNHPLAMVCAPIDGSLPVTERLERPYFDLGRLDWRDAIDEPGGIEFNLPISSWIRLFHHIGFDITDYTENQARLLGKVRSALTYPAIMLILSATILFFLLSYVVPKVTRIFQETHQQLPLPTRFLLGISDFAAQWWWLVLLVIAGIALGARAGLGRPRDASGSTSGRSPCRTSAG